MGTYLHRIERAETERCWECTSKARMDMRYVLFDYSAWMEEKRKMRKKCEDESGGKPRTARQLMSSRKTTPKVLGFIAATGVGQRGKK